MSCLCGGGIVLAVWVAGTAPAAAAGADVAAGADAAFFLEHGVVLRLGTGLFFTRVAGDSWAASCSFALAVAACSFALAVAADADANAEADADAAIFLAHGGVSRVSQLGT